MNEVFRFSRDVLDLCGMIAAYNHRRARQELEDTGLTAARSSDLTLSQNAYVAEQMAEGIFEDDEWRSLSDPELSYQIKQLLASLRERRSLKLYFACACYSRTGVAEPFDRRHTSLHDQWLTLAEEWAANVTAPCDHSGGHWCWSAGMDLAYRELAADLTSEAAIAGKLFADEISRDDCGDRESNHSTEDTRRDDFCFDLFQRDCTYEQINQALHAHPVFECYADYHSVRGPIERAAKRRGVDVAKRTAGRPPKEKRGKAE